MRFMLTVVTGIGVVCTARYAPGNWHLLAYAVLVIDRLLVSSDGRRRG